jgi:hypothetical protein
MLVGKSEARACPHVEGIHVGSRRAATTMLGANTQLPLTLLVKNSRLVPFWTYAGLRVGHTDCHVTPASSVLKWDMCTGYSQPWKYFQILPSWFSTLPCTIPVSQRTPQISTAAE